MRVTMNLQCLLFLFLCLEQVFLVGQEKPESEKEFEKVIEFLQSKDPQKRMEAAKKLAHLEIQTTWAIPVLIDALKDDNWNVRFSCFHTLAKAGKKAVPFLCKALHNENKRIKCLASGILGKIGQKGMPESDARPAIPILIKIAEEDKDISYVKSSAIWALGRIGPDAIESIPTLLNLLRNEELKSYWAEPPFLGFLMGWGRMPRPSVLGRYIINALGDMNAIAVLTYLLRDPDEDIVLWTLDTIGKKGGAPEAVPVLIDMLQRTQKTTIKLATITTLACRGEEYVPAIPFLIKALQDADVNVRIRAIRAFGYIGPKAAVSIPYLIQALYDKDPRVKEGAAFSLGCMGKQAAVALPKLLKALPNESHQVQEAIHEAIRSIQMEQKK